MLRRRRALVCLALPFLQLQTTGEILRHLHQKVHLCLFYQPTPLYAPKEMKKTPKEAAFQNTICYACSYVGMKVHNRFAKQPRKKLFFSSLERYISCIDVLSLGWGLVYMYISLAMLSSSDLFISSINHGSSNLLTQPMSAENLPTRWATSQLFSSQKKNPQSLPLLR